MPALGSYKKKCLIVIYTSSLKLFFSEIKAFAFNLSHKALSLFLLINKALVAMQSDNQALFETILTVSKLLVLKPVFGLKIWLYFLVGSNMVPLALEVATALFVNLITVLIPSELWISIFHGLLLS